MLEWQTAADSNSAVRKDVWVQVPLAAPDRPNLGVECRATPPDATKCVDDQGLGAEYPYLLGLYLGDGMLSQARRGVWRLRISLDAKYPGIVASARAAIGDVTTRSAGQIPRPGSVEVYSDWKHWVCAFPQHGHGRKHERPISLQPWQERLISDHPDRFLAGLINSDGCRCMNRVKEYVYPRYFFSNRSADIRAIFAATCQSLGVECRPNGRDSLSVARRGSVAILDRLVGPKL